MINFIVPLLTIFFLRIADVSLGTLRIVFLVRGKKLLAGCFAFIESILWLVAASQVLQNLDSPYKLVAYAAGYAVGTYIGTILEGLLALGSSMLRVVSPIENNAVADSLRQEGYQATVVNAEGRDGGVRITFSVVPRRQLKRIYKLIADINPNAFVTVDETQQTNLNIYAAVPAARVRK